MWYLDKFSLRDTRTYLTPMCLSQFLIDQKIHFKYVTYAFIILFFRSVLTPNERYQAWYYLNKNLLIILLFIASLKPKDIFTILKIIIRLESLIMERNSLSSSTLKHRPLPWFICLLYHKNTLKYKNINLK